MRNFILILALFAACAGYAQDINQLIADEQTGNLILYGYCDRHGIETGVMAEDFDQQYHGYDFSVDELMPYSDLFHQVEITVVFGSWCSDSREQLPRFLKILDQLGIPPDRVVLIATDRTKTHASIDVSRYEIQKVPTFIFYHEGREVGRITETPVERLEIDLAIILSNIRK